MIQGIIFDCFGVLYEGSLDYLVELAPPENQSAVRDASRSADYGYISAEEYTNQISSLIGLPAEKVMEIARERHVRNDILVEYIKYLKPNYKLAMLSNVGRRVMDELFPKEELEELFDAVVLSSEVGMAKPDLAIYELTALRLSLDPRACVMIDDIPGNVEAAEATNMSGIVYRSVSQLKTDLEGILKTGRASA